MWPLPFCALAYVKIASSRIPKSYIHRFTVSTVSGFDWKVQTTLLYILHKLLPVLTPPVLLCYNTIIRQSYLNKQVCNMHRVMLYVSMSQSSPPVFVMPPQKGDKVILILTKRGASVLTTSSWTKAPWLWNFRSSCLPDRSGWSTWTMCSESLVMLEGLLC